MANPCTLEIEQETQILETRLCSNWTSTPGYSTRFRPRCWSVKKKEFWRSKSKQMKIPTPSYILQRPTPTLRQGTKRVEQIKVQFWSVKLTTQLCSQWSRQLTHLHTLVLTLLIYKIGGQHTPSSDINQWMRWSSQSSTSRVLIHNRCKKHLIGTLRWLLAKWLLLSNPSLMLTCRCPQSCRRHKIKTISIDSSCDKTAETMWM